MVTLLKSVISHYYALNVPSFIYLPHYILHFSCSGNYEFTLKFYNFTVIYKRGKQLGLKNVKVIFLSTSFERKHPTNGDLVRQLEVVSSGSIFPLLGISANAHCILGASLPGSLGFSRASAHPTSLAEAYFRSLS